MLQQPPPQNAAPSDSASTGLPPTQGFGGLEPAADDASPAYEPVVRAGERLRRARTQLGLTLDQASDRLRIRKDYLAALEDMNVKLLPGKAYAIPYLRSYGRLLGLDSEALVTQFQAESALSREDATPQIRNPASKPRSERPWLWALALIGVIGAFVGYQALHEPAGAPSSTASDGQPSTQSANAAGKAAGDGAATTPARPVAPAVVGDGLPFGVAAQKVDVKALAPMWLDVRTPNGTIMLSQELAAGQVYQPDPGAGWTLHTRDGGAFEIFVNGESAGLLGQPGAPVLGRSVDAVVAAVLAAKAPPAIADNTAPVAVPKTAAMPNLALPPAGPPIGALRTDARPVQRAAAPRESGPRAAAPPRQAQAAAKTQVRDAPAAPAPPKTAPTAPESWEIGEGVTSPGG
jgi:transcriptional regulator with XRE-family HTH domain